MHEENTLRLRTKEVFEVLVTRTKGSCLYYSPTLALKWNRAERVSEYRSTSRTGLEEQSPPLNSAKGISNTHTYPPHTHTSSSRRLGASGAEEEVSGQWEEPGKRQCWSLGTSQDGRGSRHRTACWHSQESQLTPGQVRGLQRRLQARDCQQRSLQGYHASTNGQEVDAGTARDTD